MCVCDFDLPEVKRMLFVEPAIFDVTYGHMQV